MNPDPHTDDLTSPRLASRGLPSGSWKVLPRRRPRRRSRSRCEQAKRNQLGDIRGVRERPGGLTDRLPGHSVRRPHKRRPQPLGGRHPRRTVKPIHSPGRRRGQHRRFGDTGGNRSGGSSAAPPGAVSHLGPRTLNGRLAKNLGRDQSACVLLRPPLSLATTHQRKHQRHAPQMATQKHQPQHRPNPPLPHREPHQPHAQTTPPMARPTHPLPSTNQRPPLELALVVAHTNSYPSFSSPPDRILRKMAFGNILKLGDRLPQTRLHRNQQHKRHRRYSHQTRPQRPRPNHTFLLPSNDV